MVADRVLHTTTVGIRKHSLGGINRSSSDICYYMSILHSYYMSIALNTCFANNFNKYCGNSSDTMSIMAVITHADPEGSPLTVFV